MGVDLMPRLMKVTGSNIKMNKLVNEQMELGMLVASIGVVGILILSPIILHLLYSAEFQAGTNIIRWQVLGVSLRILAFPFSYGIMARGKSLIYIIVQSVFWVGEYLLLILFVNLFGFDGLGINYFIAYAGYFSMTLIACHYIFEFKFSGLLKKIVVVSYLFIAAAFLLSDILPNIHSITTGLVLMIGQALWINHQLKSKMDMNLWQYIKGKLNKKRNKSEE
jgi:PST family polysaccharide transporter